MGYLYKLIIIIAGSFFLAIGINFFLIPFRILDGGMIGLSLILNYLTGVKVGLMIILLSSPIYLYAWYKYRFFFYNSLLGMLLSSFIIDLLYPTLYYFTYYVRLTPMLSSIIGGGFVGVGIGVMLRNNTSISGTDMLAQILAVHLHMNVGVMIFFFDLIVVSFGGLFISFETFYLSILTITAVGITTSLVTLHHRFEEHGNPGEEIIF